MTDAEDDLPDLSELWPERLRRVLEVQARTDPTGMTRPPRDPNERAFLAARGLLGPFREVPEPEDAAAGGEEDPAPSPES